MNLIPSKIADLDVDIDTMTSFSKIVCHLTYLTKYRVASPCIDRSSPEQMNTYRTIFRQRKLDGGL